MNTSMIPTFSTQSLLPSNLDQDGPQWQSAVAFTPSSDDIAYRAFLNYQNHGSADGHDFLDWIRAEAELIAEHKYESPTY